MKEIIQNEKYGTIEFSQGDFWGKNSISINGTELEKINNKQFKMEDGTLVNVVGGSFSGIKLQINDEAVQITNPGKWYEILIYILGFVVMIVWSNSVALCSIIPMIGGAIGGILYAIPAVFGYNLSVKQKNPVLKIVITTCAILIGLFLCIIAGVLFVAALS